eukprot:8287814-Alexandrium_andersonii.AAC.1
MRGCVLSRACASACAHEWMHKVALLHGRTDAQLHGRAAARSRNGCMAAWPRGCTAARMRGRAD